MRLAYNLFTQKPKQELADFRQWTQMTKPGAGDDFYRMNGAGEMLVYSAADFEDFLEPRPDTAARDGIGAQGRCPSSGRKSLAVSAARDLRRDDHTRPERL